MPLALLYAIALSQTPISAALQPFVDRFQLAGAVVAVGDERKILGIETVGWADVPAQKPMRKDSLFWIASMTKSVTGAAVMALVDDGKLQLDDPVSKYLPALANVMLKVEGDDAHILLHRPSRPITLRMLMNHTSGYPPFSPMEDGIILPLWLAERAYAMTPLQSEPGERWSYSNAGVNLAGRVVEAVSGMPFETFVQRRILDPLGMRDTTFSPNRKQIARLAKSYRPKEGGGSFVEVPIFLAEMPLEPKRRDPMPSGGLYSTATDMTRFCQMILNRGQLRGRRVLSEAAVKEMTTNRLTPEMNQVYGVGWFANADGSGGHNGAYGTYMSVYPSLHRTVVILMQHPTIQRDGPGAIYDTIFTTAFKAYR